MTTARKPAPKKTPKETPKKTAARKAAASPKPAAPSSTGYEVRFFASQAAFESWLEAEHRRAPGVWVKFAKKDSGLASVNYKQALDVALCFGWIDGQSRSLDATFYLQKFTPRGKKSLWSKINRAKVAALLEAGSMRPAGLAEVERARADGRWDAAYDSPRNATVPDDLAAALTADPAAREFFASLDSANRYAVIFRVQTASATARPARIQKLVAMLARREVF